jgi:hypothetical protein
LSLTLLLGLCAAQQAYAQAGCVFKPPSLIIDFGTAAKPARLDQTNLKNYSLDPSTCPNDGYYAFVTSTTHCFGNDWHTFTEDHTQGDRDGEMMVVNANPGGGNFFITTLRGLKGNARYEFSVWLVNVCRIFGGCAPLPPNIVINLRANGNTIAAFKTGLLSQNATPLWRRYFAMFTTPPDVTTLTVVMEDVTLGGCGNDFAMDDIIVRECVTPPVAKAPVKTNKPNATSTKSVAKQTTVVTAPTVKQLQPVKNDSLATITGIKTMDTGQITKPLTHKQTVTLPVPKPLLTRANRLIKHIDAPAGEMTIELYDNGQIDGDTVSVYRNNELIVSKAALTAKPITMQINVDAMHPHHELVMVADNLGSIPPNTSLMIITTKNQRYEVFISSSEQKNAKVAIDLKE